MMCIADATVLRIWEGRYREYPLSRHCLVMIVICSIVSNTVPRILKQVRFRLESFQTLVAPGHRKFDLRMSLRMTESLVQILVEESLNFHCW